MVYFTADMHLGHENIIKYCNRPFESAEAMDSELIDNWNELVRPTDVVYHVGDFTLRSRKWALSYIERLNGYIRFVPGSHDRWLSQQLPPSDRFEVLPPLVTIEYKRYENDADSQLIVLCHYAMKTWDRQHYGSWNLYGHSHGKLSAEPLALDVGVDAQQYYPVGLEEIAEYFQLRD